MHYYYLGLFLSYYMYVSSMVATLCGYIKKVGQISRLFSRKHNFVCANTAFASQQNQHLIEPRNDLAMVIQVHEAI